MNEVYTIEEAAQILHVSTETIRRRIKDGSIRAIKIGRVYRISRVELDRIIEEGL